VGRIRAFKNTLIKGKRDYERIQADGRWVMDGGMMMKMLFKYLSR
jgi:hypothetical protein